MDDQGKAQFPSAQDFFTKIPLYSSYSFDAIAQIFAVEFFAGTIDSFCVDCSRDSVFKSDVEMPLILAANAWRRPATTEETTQGTNINNDQRPSLFRPHNLPNPSTPYLSEYFLSDRFFVVRFHCTRVATHFMHFCFVVHERALVKIGQYPSMADIEGMALQKYRKVLSEEKYRELNRAVGLTTHGVGIGAFVYLRRLFEDLLEEARNTAASSIPSWDNAKYETAHTDEKILLLKSFLPAFLVENRKLYGILSTGIHELSEDECLRHFPVVKLAIELILDEKIRHKDTETKIDEVSGALTRIKGELDKKQPDQA